MDQLLSLLSIMSQNPNLQKSILPILKMIIHSEFLTELVKQSKSPVDDLILKILRTLVPPG